jgi:hypothetical protein
MVLSTNTREFFLELFKNPTFVSNKSNLVSISLILISEKKTNSIYKRYQVLFGPDSSATVGRQPSYQAAPSRCSSGPLPPWASSRARA